MSATATRKGPAGHRLEAELVPLSSLNPYGRNPRRGDVEAIRASLRANGQFRPLVVRRKTREVLAGNHTLQAAEAEGWSEIWVTFLDVDAKTAKRIVLADNRTSDLAGYDNEVLAELLGELPNLEGTGYDRGAYDRLLAATLPDAPPPPDSAPARPKRAQTHEGDLYLLGHHRLVCGDTADPAVLEHALGGGMSDMLWTDPPYGVDYVGGTKKALTIQGDGREGLEDRLDEWFTAIGTVLEPGAPIYVCYPTGSQLPPFVRAFSRVWDLRQTIVWVKDAIVLGHSDYHYRHESILFGEAPTPEDAPERGDEHQPLALAYQPDGKGRPGRGGDRWFGDNKQASVLTVPRPKASKDHPTMKPIDLVEVALRNSSAPGYRVLDPFAGSGSTLMACEHLGRRAVCLEIDPGYCDVIVARWEAHTGQKAERVR